MAGVGLSPERFLVVVDGGKSAQLGFRTEEAAKGFMDYAVTGGGAARVRLFVDGVLVEDRRAA